MGTTAWCQSSHQVLAVGEGVALKNATRAWATVTPTKIANPACPASVAWALRRSLDALATEHAMLATALREHRLRCLGTCMPEKIGFPSNTGLSGSESPPRGRWIK